MRIQGELRKLGIRVGGEHDPADPTSCRPGTGARRTGPTWSEFLRAQGRGVLACDLFTVETVFLKTLYVLFFIELSTRQAPTADPTRPGSPSRLGTSRSRETLRASTSCSGTETQSSQVPSMKCFERKDSRR